MPREIVICGGGVAGAAMACALADQHFSVTLLEKDPLRDVGHVRRGEALRSEVCQFLTELGLMSYFEQQRPVTRLGEKRELWHTAVGKLGHFRYDYLAPGYPVMHLTYPQIVNALYGRLERASKLNVKFEAEATAVGDWKEGKRRVLYKSRSEGSEQELIADLVIVADGAGSQLRRGLGIGIEQHDYGLGYLMFYLQRPEGMEWGRFYVGPAGFIGIFPTSGNLIRAAVEVKVEELKEWLSASREDQYRRLIARTPLLEGLKLDDVGIFYHVIRRHAHRYTADGLCLIGDAAHTTHPMLAQGISLVFNDIRALYGVLAANQSGPFPESMLRQYEARARPFNSAVLQNNHNLFTWLGRIGEDHSFYPTILPELQRLGFDPS